MGTYLEEFSPEHFNMLKLAGMHWWLVLECDVCDLLTIFWCLFCVLPVMLWCPWSDIWLPDCDICDLILVTMLPFQWSGICWSCCLYVHGLISGYQIVISVVWYLVTMLPFQWSGIWWPCCLHVHGLISDDQVVISVVWYLIVMSMTLYLVTMVWHLVTMLSCPRSNIWLPCCCIYGLIPCCQVHGLIDIWLSCCHGDVLLPVSMVWCINV
jgi:hypothetical protein